jgi:hypothetical protein
VTTRQPAGAGDRPIGDVAGGYNGTDPAVSLAAFEALVSAGKVHYYVADQQGFIGSTAANTSTAYAIQQWVAANFRAQTVGGTTVYDRRRSAPGKRRFVLSGLS